VWWAGGLAWRWIARAPVEARQRWSAQRLVALIRALGATYVKVGQILSTRPDLLPPLLIAELEQLQDRVGAFPYRAVRQVFLEELGRPPEELFAEFSPTPLASASVAQVHRARLADGRTVAVKVRRPKLERIVDHDLTLLRSGARLLERFETLRPTAPVETVEEFGRAIRSQLDLRIEARNSARFRANFAQDADVLFPMVFEELSTERILTMEFVDGAKILEAARTPEEGRRLAALGFRTLFRMIFVDGFVHADLHPGNLRVTPEGRLALFDVGMIGELDDTHRDGFARYFAAWSVGDGKTMARIMSQLSPSAEISRYAAFEAEVVDFARRYHGLTLGEVQVSGVLLDVLGILRRHRVRANAIFTLVNIAICVTEGIGKQLDPSVDLTSSALPFFTQLGWAPSEARPPEVC
jgi:ubiquinone biosynthesis protein